MTISAELFQSLLLLASTFAIVGVSWQLMRLLSKTTETMDEFKKTNQKVNVLIDKVENDYIYISNTVKALSNTIDRINEEIITPVRSISNLFKTFDAAKKVIWGRIKSETAPEDYLPELEN
jgi:hypothetical protein